MTASTLVTGGARTSGARTVEAVGAADRELVTLDALWPSTADVRHPDVRQLGGRPAS